MSFEVDDAAYELIASQCNQVDVGARQVDHILDQTVLPDLSRRLLQQMSSDKMPSGVRMGVDDNNEFTYEFSFEGE